MTTYCATYQDDVLYQIIRRNSPIGKLEQTLICKLNLDPDDHILRPSGELNYENASEVEIGTIEFTEGNIFTIDHLKNVENIIEDFYKQRGFKISDKHTDILKNNFTSRGEYKYINMNAKKQDKELIITIGDGDNYFVAVANPFKVPEFEPIINLKLIK